MAVNAHTTIHFAGTVPSSVADGSRLVDTATVTLTEADADPANNAAAAPEIVVAASVPTAPASSGAEIAGLGTAQPTSSGPSGPLPFTGADLMFWLRAACILIGSATGLWLVGGPLVGVLGETRTPKLLIRS